VISLDETICDEGSKEIMLRDKVTDASPTSEDWLEDIMLKRAIETLSEREREILAMRYFEGKTQVEVSQEVGISQAQVSRLEKNALALDPRETGITALDWFNGRRTPDADQRLKGAITGLNLGSDAPRIYRALVEATAFGARAIVERFREEGVAIEGIIGVGGVARKSPFVMQILADVLNMPIHIPLSDQSVALGAAMFAAVVAGLYPDIPAAQKALCSPIDKIYKPNQEAVKVYGELYRRYKTLGAFVEEQTLKL